MTTYHNLPLELKRRIVQSASNNNAARLHLADQCVIPAAARQISLFHEHRSAQVQAMLTRLQTLLNFLSQLVLEDAANDNTMIYISVEPTSNDDFDIEIKPYAEYAFTLKAGGSVAKQEMAAGAVLNYVAAVQRRHRPFRMDLINAPLSFGPPTYGSPLP